MYVDQFDISGTGSGAAYGCRISPRRIILLSVVSMGIYWLYWMYRTWKQFRDHTLERAAAAGQQHYPIWHGLTQFLPVYGWFRFHAHVREYQGLMQERGVADSLNLGNLTTIVVVSSLLSWIGGGIRQEYLPDGVVLLGYILTVIAVVLSITVMLTVQSNLNNYWMNAGGGLEQDARFGKGEIVCIVLGVLLWLGIVAGIIWSS